MNPGILQFGHTHEFDLDAWNRILGINLTGTFLTCRESIPHLLETCGNIVNIASNAGLMGQGFTSAYCTANVNSSGVAAQISATGSTRIQDNALDLHVDGLPLGQFGYFLMSATSAMIPVASGLLCLGGPQLRFSANVLNSGAGGAVSFSPDLTNLPQGQVVLPGETWFFQVWFRESAAAGHSNTTDAVQVTLR